MRAGTCETELAPLRATDHRPGSRLEVERRQTRSRTWGFRACTHLEYVRFGTGKPEGLVVRLSELGEGFWGKEFSFADI